MRSILLDAAVYHPKQCYVYKYGLDPNKTISDADQDRIAKDLDLGRWNFYGALYVSSPPQA
jgi:hypothetical protein